MLKKIAFLLCFVDLSLAGPLGKIRELRVKMEETSSVKMLGVVPVQEERQAAVIGVLGSAIAPIVGAVVGPILTNLANGLVGVLTGNRPGSSGSKPSFDAYMIQVPGAEGPYMLLTQETALGGVEGPYRTPSGGLMNISPIGKVNIKHNPILPIKPETDDEVTVEDLKGADDEDSSPH
ncbi:uncharacterized protein LOC106665207 [Cimex lectularius]|uniref:Uncharacterized protein n=1 Tax=Cimex lectularius TaxID=79782 RepID=A0A8I6TDJ1_CIMLE|nr:uncharacterized protein LOC106665207 [Cimex lectularius]